MIKNKIKVAILFGGKSAEHEVSLRSAKNVFNALDQKKYSPILIKISKSGEWFLCENFESKKLGERVALIPESKGKLLNVAQGKFGEKIDVVFPILHGPFGEDGTVQGLLKLAGVPFVGAGVLGSSVGMDKDVMKRLLRDAKIPVSKFLVFHDFEKVVFEDVAEKLGLPFFVKPANLGSSVGISKVKSKKDFAKAIADAFLYDTKIIIEEFVSGREVECAVLGLDDPQASVVGEIVVKSEFYSYETKYIDEKSVSLEIPAKISQNVEKKIQGLAVKTFQVLCCEGLGRVDCFLTKNGKIFVNEINTIPGFTSVSMYPMLWGASGLSYGELVDQLIQLAIVRFEKEKKIITSL